MRVRGRQINLRSSYTLADVCGTIFIGTCAPQAASRPIVDCLTWCSAGVCVCVYGRGENRAGCLLCSESAGLLSVRCRRHKQNQKMCVRYL